MNRFFRAANRHRRGTAALLFGLMLPLFLGLTALSIDLSVLAVSKAQLNTAADAGARVELGTPLADQDFARVNGLAAETLDAKALGVGIATVT